jgi:Mn-dependent DtxR family transcriptional regulator
MRITEATENYMEAILVLSEHLDSVRAVDIANYLGFSKPTISQYMKQYVQQGLVEVGSDGHIHLTDEGRKVAEATLERHRIISAIFMALGVSKETALEDACKVEHDLSDETFNCMKAHYLKHIHK